MKFLISSMLFLSCLSFAKDFAPTQVMKIKGKLAGDNDLSGITCIENDCYVITDDAPLIQVLTLDVGKYKLTHKEDIILEKSTVDLDLEGIAYENGKIFMVSSHSERDGDHSKSRYSFITYTIKTNTFEYKSILPVLESHPVLKNYLKKNLKKNGLNIEGLAARDGKIFVGLRAPYVNGVYILELDSDLKFIKDHLVKTEKAFGIRAMANFRDGFLMVVGDALPDKNIIESIAKDQSFLVYYDMKDLHKIGKFTTSGKVEGIELIRDKGGEIHFITLTDSSKEGEPGYYVLKDSDFKDK